MSREVWNTIKNSKFFYIRTYRKAGSLLLVSLGLNVLMGLGVYYLYFNQPERDFYATNGETSPIKLQPLDEPNYSATPLLPPDPPDEDKARIIPQ